MDVVILVRRGDRNEELRYALRAIERHIPHDRVVIVGHKPPWVRNVVHVRTRQSGTKYANTTEAVRVACRTDDISDPWLMTHDDIFAMSRMPARLPHYHRGPIRDVEAHYANKRMRGRYYTGMVETRKLLQRMGFDDPLSYEVHVPMLVHKDEMLEALDAGKSLRVPHKRSLYGNMAMLGGVRIRDPKVLTMGAFARSDWLSTLDSVFDRGQVGRYIRSKFPSSSKYEGRSVRRIR